MAHVLNLNAVWHMCGLKGLFRVTGNSKVPPGNQVSQAGVPPSHQPVGLVPRPSTLPHRPYHLQAHPFHTALDPTLLPYAPFTSRPHATPTAHEPVVRLLWKEGLRMSMGQSMKRARVSCHSPPVHAESRAA
jgi:hypothetical protein